MRRAERPACFVCTGACDLDRLKEEGESAKTTDRTELQKLLKYCRAHKGKVHFVVVYNLTRFAREKYDHFALRAHLKSLGISLRSATEPIDDTSTGKLMEGVLAAFAQFDNDVRSDRTRAGMRAALDVSKAKLEGLFVDELALLQPTPGYMRLVKERVLYVWRQLTSEVKDRAAEVGRRVKGIQQKLDRLDEAFVYAQTIDTTSYERQRDRLREELTLAQIDRGGATPSRSKNSTWRASWRSQNAFCRAPRTVGASVLESETAPAAVVPTRRHRDGNRFNRTAATAPFFKYLARGESAEEVW